VCLWEIGPESRGGIRVDVKAESDLHPRGLQACARSTATGVEIEDFYLHRTSRHFKIRISLILLGVAAPLQGIYNSFF
jgi:hypothetical protein